MEKIVVCPNCLEPRLGGNEDRTWCMNYDCDYVWLAYERKGSAKILNRINTWWWIRVERDLIVEMWKVVYAMIRPFKEWKKRAKK